MFRVKKTRCHSYLDATPRDLSTRKPLSLHHYLGKKVASLSPLCLTPARFTAPLSSPNQHSPWNASFGGDTGAEPRKKEPPDKAKKLRKRKPPDKTQRGKKSRKKSYVDPRVKKLMRQHVPPVPPSDELIAMIEGSKTTNPNIVTHKPILEDVTHSDGEDDLEEGEAVYEVDEEEKENALYKINTLVIPDSHISSQKSNSDIISEPLTNHDDATVKTSVNILKEHKPKHILQDEFVAQIDPGALASVTNNLNLLHDVVHFGPNKRCWTRMKGATSKKHITPTAKGKLRVPALNIKGYIDVKCYYHPEFTATLVSDNDVLGT